MAHTRRLHDQEWMFDKLIASGGPDFYWPMTEETLCAVGMDASGDVRTARASIRKFVDITNEMVRLAGKREGLAREAEAEGHRETARDNYFTAACFYTMRSDHRLRARRLGTRAARSRTRRSSHRRAASRTRRVW